MKYETLERIDPRLFRAYLKIQGWKYEGHFTHVEEYWKKDGYDLTLPLGTDKKDYGLRMGEAATTLSASLPMTVEHVVAMMATGRVKNWLIASLIEPDLPDITTDEWGQAVVEKKSHSVLPWGSPDFSPERGWYIVSVYEEGDEPRWEPRNFTGHFESTVWAYEQLYGEHGELFLEKDGDQWMASNHIDVVHPPGQGKKACWAGSASEAVCNLILELGGILD